MSGLCREVALHEKVKAEYRTLPTNIQHQFLYGGNPAVAIWFHKVNETSTSFFTHLNLNSPARRFIIHMNYYHDMLMKLSPMKQVLEWVHADTKCFRYYLIERGQNLGVFDIMHEMVMYSMIPENQRLNQWKTGAPDAALEVVRRWEATSLEDLWSIAFDQLSELELEMIDEDSSSSVLPGGRRSIRLMNKLGDGAGGV